jgi:RimJ/RimL family protein N-acetyltransferase
VIGDCGLEIMELDGVTEYELGYDLRRDHWGQGFATEAAMAVKAHALGALQLPRLVSLVRSGNRRSARVAEKLGMVWEREMRRDEVSYDLYATPAGTEGAA